MYNKYSENRSCDIRKKLSLNLSQM